MASFFNPIGSSTPAANTGSTTTAPSGAATQQMFLKLLVSQLQNQDPMNPTDSTQFVAQLAQFSELEQVMAIRADLDSLTAAPVTPAPDPSTTTNSTPTI